MKINWKQKLTSRKFWAAAMGFVTAILVAFGVNDMTVSQIIAVITAASTLIAYIIGEGLVDVARLNSSSEATKTTNSTDTEASLTIKGFTTTNNDDIINKCNESEEI